MLFEPQSHYLRVLVRYLRVRKESIAIISKMAEIINPIDRLKTRLVFKSIDHIQEHLEAMQRDPHGLEYGPWKKEVDNIWKEVFSQINEMSEDPQKLVLEAMRDTWVSYITHYGAVES